MLVAAINKIAANPKLTLPNITILGLTIYASKARKHN